MKKIKLFTVFVIFFSNFVNANDNAKIRGEDKDSFEEERTSYWVNHRNRFNPRLNRFNRFNFSNRFNYYRYNPYHRFYAYYGNGFNGFYGFNYNSYLNAFSRQPGVICTSINGQTTMFYGVGQNMLQASQNAMAACRIAYNGFYSNSCYLYQCRAIY